MCAEKWLLEYMSAIDFIFFSLDFNTGSFWFLAVVDDVKHLHHFGLRFEMS